MSLPRMRLDLPVGLVLLSAVWGASISAVPQSAWVRFFFVCAGIGLYYVFSRMPAHVFWHHRDLPLLRAVVGVAPALLATYFLITNDWQQPVDKVAWLEGVRTWLASRETRTFLPALHPNVAGGLLAMMLPLQVAALRVSNHGRATAQPLRWLLAVISFSALILSSLRGAWLALAASTGVWLLWRMTRRISAERGRLVAGALWAGVLLVLVTVGMMWGARLLALRPDRATVWQDSWKLAWDYFFTGLGFGSFTMAYSSYALLVHVPYVTHAHNLFLNIWLDQGILGLLAFAWLLAAAFASGRRRATGARSSSSRAPHARWQEAAAIALLVIVFHGLVDDVYYGYGNGGALALFVPVALLARADRHGARRMTPQGRPRAWVAWGLSVAAAVVVLVFGPGRALLEANLGALLQTRAELSVYRWPEWPVQDAVRRSSRIDLRPAIAHYRAALVARSTCAQANRRLGQIELSLGDYDNARQYLEVAYQEDPDQHATRQMLGESLALTGDLGRAAALWRTLPLGQDQLVIRQAWYDSTNDPLRAGWFRAAVERAGGK